MWRQSGATSPTPATKAVTWGKAVDFLEREDRPVLENVVVAYDTNGAAKDVLYLKEFKGRFKNRNPSKVVVKVEACTVSRMDCQIRQNIFHHHVSNPHIPGCDMVGTVIQVGTKAKRYGFQVGDRVCALDLKLGGNAKYVVAHSYQLMKVPPELDAAVVACLIRTYVTAYQVLYRAGETCIRKGDKILMVGGGGCIGQAVLQLAKIAGASEMYATCEGAKSRQIISKLGATPLGKEPWQWLPIIEGRMNIVIDSVCHDGYDSSYKALSRHGKLVILGDMSRSEQGYISYFLSQHKLHFNMVKASYTMDRATIYDLFEEYNEYPDQYERDLRLLFRMLEDGEIDPNIVKYIPLKEVPNAHKEIEEGGVGGAIVCLPFSSEINTPEKAAQKKEKKVSPKERSLFSALESEKKTKTTSPQRETREENDDSREKADGRMNSDIRKKKDGGEQKDEKCGSFIEVKGSEDDDGVLGSIAVLLHEVTIGESRQQCDSSLGSGRSTKKKAFAALQKGSFLPNSCLKKRIGSVLKSCNYNQDEAESNEGDEISSIDLKVEQEEQKASAATAAAIQAKKLEAMVLQADADAKRAEAQALKARVEAKKAEAALLVSSVRK